MNKLIFALPGNEFLAGKLSELLTAEQGTLKFHQFPDGETFIQNLSEVDGKEIILVCNLNQPNAKILPLYFLAKEIRNCGGAKITLVAPYLGYMRQDKAFHRGEIVTSKYFAELISSLADELITVDPHLHRWKKMSEIYSIPCQVVHASKCIAHYIKKSIKNPVLIGPDSESMQWVSEVARQADAPFLILEKKRRGDKDVEVSVPEVEKYLERTPVLVDDIISTAHTMLETITHLKKAEMKPPTCIGIHGIFADDAYEKLVQAEAEIITCNTILHPSNKIDLTRLIAQNLSGRSDF